MYLIIEKIGHGECSICHEDIPSCKCNTGYRDADDLVSGYEDLIRACSCPDQNRSEKNCTDKRSNQG